MLICSATRKLRAFFARTLKSKKVGTVGLFFDHEEVDGEEEIKTSSFALEPKKIKFINEDDDDRYFDDIPVDDFYFKEVEPLRGKVYGTNQNMLFYGFEAGKRMRKGNIRYESKIWDPYGKVDFASDPEDEEDLNLEFSQKQEATNVRDMRWLDDFPIQNRFYTRAVSPSPDDTSSNKRSVAEKPLRYGHSQTLGK